MKAKHNQEDAITKETRDCKLKLKRYFNFKNMIKTRSLEAMINIPTWFAWFRGEICQDPLKASITIASFTSTLSSSLFELYIVLGKKMKSY